MLRPRWQKILTDIWKNKSRSLLTIASIAVGLLAFGIIANLYFWLNEDMTTGFAAVNPANIQFKTSLIDHDMVEHVGRISGVKQVDATREFTMLIQADDGTWANINIMSKDFDKAQTGKLTLVEGTWPLKKNQIALSNHKLKDLGIKLGDTVTLKNSDGHLFTLQVAAVVKDQMLGTAGGAGGFFAADEQGYIIPSTLKKLQIPYSDYYNKLYITTTGDATKAAVREEVSGRIHKDLEDNNVTIISYSTRSPYSHPNIDLCNAIVSLLLMLTFLIVFLSGFLITNTLQFLLTQQIQQVGIMKSVGATRRQIVMIYAAMITVFGVLAFFFTLPVTRLVTDRLMVFLSDRINFTYYGARTTAAVFIVQILLALVVPLISASGPVLRGTSLSVQEALSGIQQQVSTNATPWLDRLLARMKSLSRPNLIAVRNVFRNRNRLVLTLITLSLAGAVFISVFSVRVSFNNYIQSLNRYFLADLNISLASPVRIQEMEDLLYSNPQVGYVEGWSSGRVSVVKEDGTAGDSVNFMAAPNGSQLIEPMIISGRWLDPRDENAIVLADQFQRNYPQLKVGDDITLMVNGKKRDFVIVGFCQIAGKLGGLIAYGNLDYFNSLPGQTQNQAMIFRVVGKEKMTPAEQKELSSEVQSELEKRNYSISSISTGSRINQMSSEGFSILTTVLLVLAILIALVGSIGLTGTMSMNILDRTREIGIMRSIGASDKVLFRMVLIEGLLIGWISWGIGALLSFPISILLSNGINTALFGATSTFGFSFTGFLIWFVVVTILSILSSITPARSATQLTIREVLSYE